MGTSVTVRMYRHGFGDCFLLTVAEDGESRHMLIDCGVHQQDTAGQGRLAAVVADIASVTGKHLDLVVVTHDHVDHQSGFEQAEAAFAGMAVDRLWLAWTEDSTDPLARKILADRAAKAKALTALSGVAALSGLPAVQEAIGFLGPLAAAGGQSAALTILREKVGEERVEFREPADDPVAIPGVSGLRCYVLGPPRDEAIFLKSGPLDSSSDMYALGAVPGVDASLLAAALGQTGVGAADQAQWDEAREATYPFSREWRLAPPPKSPKPPPPTPSGSPEAEAFFRDHYWKKGASWRRIDGVWAGAASELALAVQKNINNTSLVLALEFIHSGKVLLFVGDAQIENWRSWEKCRWTVTRGDQTEEVTAADLLRRTVLYKVGHHGSRNATAKDEGLELMKSRELVAMIPVDPVFAHAQRPKPWQHPWPALVTALEGRTVGRVAQSNPGARSALSGGSTKGFLKALKVQPLYVEYTVAD